MTFLLTLIVNIGIFVVGVIIGVRVTLSKFYFPNGQCRECANLVKENGHHPNCPIGRLGV